MYYNRSRSYYKYKLQYIWRKLFASIKTPTSLSLWIVGIVWCVSFWLGYKIHYQLYSDQYRIDKIVYTSDSFSSYNDPNLYNYITLRYLCRYYSDIKIFHDHEWYVESIQQQYPFIRDITLSEFSDNTLVLKVSYDKPMLRFVYKDNIYGAYTHSTILLGPKDSLGNGIPILRLPIYLTTSSPAISWLLYNMDLHKILYDYLLLKTFPLSWSVTYIPWWDKYILRNNSLRIYFNAKKNMISQLHILQILMSQYRWFNTLHQIDVGSLDNPIVK